MKLEHFLTPYTKGIQCFFMVQFPHPCMITGKSIVKAMDLHVAKIFSSKDQASFRFMASVTIHSEFGAQENKVCHCFHRFPIYLPIDEVMGPNAMILVF